MLKKIATIAISALGLAALWTKVKPYLNESVRAYNSNKRKSTLTIQSQEDADVEADKAAMFTLADEMLEWDNLAAAGRKLKVLSTLYTTRDLEEFDVMRSAFAELLVTVRRVSPTPAHDVLACVAHDVEIFWSLTNSVAVGEITTTVANGIASPAHWVFMKVKRALNANW